VAVDCDHPDALVRSIAGKPGLVGYIPRLVRLVWSWWATSSPTPAAHTPPVQPQPKLDSLEVLVLRYDKMFAGQCAVQQLQVQDLQNLKFLDIRGCEVTQLHLGELPSLAGLLIENAR
jgi:hypothetical protein